MLGKKTPVVEILAIGREILDGRIVDTNSVRMAERLRLRGLVPRFAQKVDDDPERMQQALSVAEARADIILCCGGLGPTSDDLSSACMAQYLGEPLVENPQALAVLERCLQNRGRPMTPANRKQAWLPASAEALDNPLGTAAGFWIERRGKVWAFMPGVPAEMLRMLEDEVLPRLPGRPHYLSRSWATHFTAESALQERLQDLLQALPDWMELGFQTRFPENHLGLYGDADTEAKRQQYEQIADELGQLLGDEVFCVGPTLSSLEQTLVTRLCAEQAWVSTAESCTGGLVAHRLTEVAGASEFFWGARVVYENSAKVHFGVSEELLREHGAVSEAVARALAEAALNELRLHAPQAAQRPLYALATTGIAGPSGGSAAKPVGLCYVALARSQGETRCERVQAGTQHPRAAQKLYFSQKALDLLRRSLGPQKVQSAP